MVLAAGLGSRLGGLSELRPKPLLPVCDIPLIRYATALVRAAGLSEVVVNLHHLGDLLSEELGDGGDQGLRVRYSREDGKILGTGGGLRAALPLLEDEGAFFVLNGKIVFDVELQDVARRHRAAGAKATLVVRQDPDAERWGAIRVDATGRIVGILDARSPVPAVEPIVACMFTGVHIVEPELIRSLPLGEERCVIRDVYIPQLLAGARLEGYVATGYFHEHSTPARYLEGNVNLLLGRGCVRALPGEVRGVDPQARLGRGAVVVEQTRVGAGADVGPEASLGAGTVVGRGSVVGAHCRLERVVLWPGSRLEAHTVLRSAIVTPVGVVHVPEDSRSAANG